MITEFRMLIITWLLSLIDLIHPNNDEYIYWLEAQKDYCKKCLPELVGRRSEQHSLK